MNEKSFRFSVGNLECIALRDAADGMPTNALIQGADEPAIAQVLRERECPLSEIPVDYLCLCVRSREKLIAIDAGCGYVEGFQGQALAHLRAEGVSPLDVSLVIVTHLDRDHLGGVVAPDGTLAFPDASHVLSEEAWFWYTSESNLAAMPEPQAAFYRTIRSLLTGRVVLVRDETEITPGIRIIPAPGHRRGHMAVELASEGARLLHLADAFVHPIFVEYPEWTTPFDDNHDEARATRRQFLARATSSGSLVFLSHFPFPGLGHVRKHAKAWRWVPLDSSSGA